jgi:hypothetical protein
LIPAAPPSWWRLPGVKRLMESGGVKPMKHQYLPGGLAAVPKVCKMLMHNEISGSKLVVHPQESLP